MSIKKKVWHRVIAPKRWYPKPGEELIGKYVGTERRTGQYGDYNIYMIKARTVVKYISGAAVNDLFTLIPFDTTVKVVFTGNKTTQDGTREYKTYEVFTEEVIEFKIAETG